MDWKAGVRPCVWSVMAALPLVPTCGGTDWNGYRLFGLLWQTSFSRQMAASKCRAPSHLWHARRTCMCCWPMGREGKIRGHDSLFILNLKGWCLFFLKRKETWNNLHTVSTQNKVTECQFIIRRGENRDRPQTAKKQINWLVLTAQRIKTQ